MFSGIDFLYRTIWAGNGHMTEDDIARLVEPRLPQLLTNLETELGKFGYQGFVSANCKIQHYNGTRAQDKVGLILSFYVTPGWVLPDGGTQLQAILKQLLQADIPELPDGAIDVRVIYLR